MHPAMVPQHSAIAEVSGVTNAVAIDADYCGSLLLIGPGAGARPTASAVASDILDIAQTLVGDYFTMIVVIDAATLDVPFADFKAAMESEVQSMGLQAMMMHEDVVNTLHRV